jgi:diguanylate cyclase (GGDEF)-like protein
VATASRVSKLSKQAAVARTEDVRPARPALDLSLQSWQLLDHVTVGLVLYEYSLDYGWFQRNCNKTYLELAERANDNLQGLPLRQIFPKDRVDAIEQKLSDCRDQQQPVMLTFEIKTKSIARFLRCDGLPVPKVPGGPDQVLVTVVDVSSERSVQRQLVAQSMIDELTGLHNRLYFTDKVESCAKKDNAPFAVLLVDLDRFQYVNETLGHVAGDELLISAARRLLTCLRTGDTFARLSSDEFGILIENVESIDDAMHVSERIHRAMMQPFQLSGQDVFVSSSIGISLSEKINEHPEDILRDADFAMHSAKKAGRGCTQVYQSDVHSKAQSLFRLETDLRRALERDELSLVYQPIVRLTDKRVTSFEALMRWNKPGGMVPPNDFIPVAEDTGLIVPMGRWAIKTAATQAALWRQQCGDAAKGLRIAINISAVQLARDDVIGALRESFEETGLDGSYLTMELTESSLVNNPKQARDLLNEMKALNLQLALDDFGTGYSSLSYLTSFPIDIVKIDRSFVSKMLCNEQDYQIVVAILTLARNLGKRVVAEGIELTEHLDELRELGCDYGQGYLFAKPLSAADAGKLIV